MKNNKKLSARVATRKETEAFSKKIKASGLAWNKKTTGHEKFY